MFLKKNTIKIPLPISSERISMWSSAEMCNDLKECYRCFGFKNSQTVRKYPAYNFVRFPEILPDNYLKFGQSETLRLCKWFSPLPVSLLWRAFPVNIQTTLIYNTSITFLCRIFYFLFVSFYFASMFFIFLPIN